MTHSRMSHRDRRGGTIINIVTGIIFFGLLAAGVLWVIKTAGDTSKQYTTELVNAKRNATTLTCQMNFRSIAQCLQAFAVSGEGFPADQQEFVTACGGHSKVLRCPDPCGVEYVYIPGARADMPETTVLVYEPEPVHEGRCNVLFLGGQIEALTPDKLQPFLDATLSHRR
jgi:prepilin-type processing-associated H-X9-DG protein